MVIKRRTIWFDYYEKRSNKEKDILKSKILENVKLNYQNLVKK